MDAFHPDVELRPFGEPTRVCRGHEAVRGYLQGLLAQGVVEAASYQFLEKDDFVVVLGAYRRREPDGGTDSSAAWVMRLRDGKIVESSGYAVSADALEAVGMRLK